MSAAAAVKGMILNLLEMENEEEVMWSNTLIKAKRFNWKRESVPLETQSLRDHKKWLEVWQVSHCVSTPPPPLDDHHFWMSTTFG
jgi:hypothetical protein